MPRPGVGNPGNKGGGRKSAYQELADAKLLWEVFTKPMTVEKIKKRIESGKYSIKDVWILKARQGNEKFIQQIVHKLFPDRKEIGGEGGGPIAVDVSIKKAIDEIYGPDSS